MLRNINMTTYDHLNIPKNKVVTLMCVIPVVRVTN